MELRAFSPLPARFDLFKDGERVVVSENIAEFSAAVSGPGVYRVEVYLDHLGGPFDQVPWIISNPIYVR